ncbi:MULTISPECIES: RagB/SusD family nutrient uptake outer membrane protein [unclassified Chryseobacterium]|uniref:RagB/SusD family nutrient uptake outer membrane protein n=1 Tax=unclassified Chryseobacterium TaxID=2593645 RepID=UPI002269D002|nr:MULTISPECIES: RagB/SusD family nutrient uptake outer membrane protein [unclassified Chryseobacterium]
MKNKILKIALLSIGLLTVSVSCSDDFVDRQFYEEVEQGQLKSVQEVESFVRGGYAQMRSRYYYGCDFLAFGEVRSDVMYSNLASGYYQNVQNYTMTSSDAYSRDTWNQIYKTVGIANVVINTDFSGFTSDDQEYASFLQGQAYAIRALGFFDILRLYGQQYTGSTTSLGAVLPLKYDPKAKQARSTVAETEAQIAADFNKAVQLMADNSDYDLKTSDRTALSLSAVKGLMARFYLYKGDYARVRQLVSQIVAVGGYSVIPAADFAGSYDFAKNGSSPNSMFELAVGNVSALGTASYRHKLSNGGYGNVVLKAGVANDLYGATTTDVRKSLITTASGTSYLSYLAANGTTRGKYMNASGADNIKMLRYEEVLLDGVEAEINGGTQSQALIYLNLIRQNRGLAAATTVDIVELKKERARELLGEGLRQWDLRRWGDAVPRPTGASTSILLNAFPIPLSETNVGAVQSNPGYDN